VAGSCEYENEQPVSTKYGVFFFFLLAEELLAF